MRPTTGPAGEPPDDIRRYLEDKGLRPSWSWREVWQEEHAVSFAVAKAMSEDVLAALQAAVTEAIAAGLSFETFRKNLETTLSELGWWGFRDQVNPDTGETERVELGTPRRLSIIYKTNGRVARAVGQWQRIQRTKSRRPYLIYELGPSAEHRPQHVSWAGTIKPADDPVWATLFPPNGWGCKCRVRQLSQAEADDAGGVTDGDIDLGGVEEGWAYNPGAAPRPAG